jgi:hypothetical protein
MKIADIICEGFDGDRHFNMSDPYVGEARNPKSRTALVHMSPADFLGLIPSEFDQDKLNNTRQLAAKGVPFKSVPTLSFIHDGKGNAKVYGHEGRHRSMALHELGVQQMPVIMRSVSGGGGPEIRWGSQHEGSFDKVPVMPRVLHGQESVKHSIPFPQNVFYPMTETKHLPGPRVAGSGKDFRQNPGVNHSSGKMPGKVAGSGKAMKVKPGFVGG